MIINVKKLTDFKSGHSTKAEIAVMNSMCFLFDLEPRGVTTGNAPGYDFRIANTSIELKISSKGEDGLIELAKADGRPGGLSATKSDLHAFLNPAGNGIAKLRLIRTWDLRQYYSIDRGDLFETETVGDKIGSILAPFNIRNFDDLFIAQCQCEFANDGLRFDTHTFTANDYGRSKIHEWIK